MSETIDSLSKNEVLKAAVTELMVTQGFPGVRYHTNGGMNFCDATFVDGTQASFWVKKDWTGGTERSAAIGLGFVSGLNSKSPDPTLLSNHVRKTVEAAESAGADYLLLIHLVEDEVRNHYALPINKVLDVYTEQLARWPRMARNGSSAQLWFYQERNRRNHECVAHVHAASVPIAAIASKTYPSTGESAAVRTVMAEVERRLQQDAFKKRLGERYGWRCAVSGNEVREVLDAAHLPGRDWRQHNTTEDGVLLRSDLHRLLDRGLATLRDGKFWIEEKALCDQYVDFNGRPIR